MELCVLNIDYTGEGVGDDGLGGPRRWNPRCQVAGAAA